jgi:hypothetical protein
VLPAPTSVLALPEEPELLELGDDDAALELEPEAELELLLLEPHAAIARDEAITAAIAVIRRGFTVISFT